MVDAASKLSPASINFGIFALWLGFSVYAFKLSPNAAVVTDKTLLEARILHGGAYEDGGTVNPIVFALFNVLGLLPALYACLLLPTGASRNGVPCWPFVSLSFFLGAFGLLPYFALWEPSDEKKVLESRSKVTGALESKAAAAGFLLAVVYLTTLVVGASGSDWAGYFALFGKSRFVHVSTLDFCVLTLMAPFWVSNDAETRKWNKG